MVWLSSGGLVGLNGFLSESSLSSTRMQFYLVVLPLFVCMYECVYVCMCVCVLCSTSYTSNFIIDVIKILPSETILEIFILRLLSH